jgi:hypothetical protein
MAKDCLDAAGAAAQEAGRRGAAFDRVEAALVRTASELVGPARRSS